MTATFATAALLLDRFSSQQRRRRRHFTSIWENLISQSQSVARRQLRLGALTHVDQHEADSSSRVAEAAAGRQAGQKIRKKYTKSKRGKPDRHKR